MKSSSFGIFRLGAFTRSLLQTAFVLLLLLTHAGCATQMLATRIVKAPNQQKVPRLLRDKEQVKELDATIYRETWRLPIATPAADLSVAVIDPGMHEFSAKFEPTIDPKTGESSDRYTSSFAWKTIEGAPSTETPKGTLVLLHGFMMTKETMIPWGMYFAQAGYRTVLVDLRGHGRSTGEWVGFGAWEAGDLVKLADELSRRGLIVGKLGVFGISYGAVMGIHWAAADPRVETVVALEPFSDPQQAIMEFARGVMPRLSRWFSDATFAEASVRSAKLAGFQWQDASVIGSAKRLRKPILVIHGRHDTWVPPERSLALMQVAGGGGVRITTTDNHMSLPLRFDETGSEAKTWFDDRFSGKPMKRSTTTEGSGPTAAAGTP